MIQNCTGIVLNKRDFMESDLIVTLLTERGERLELVAKGAGGPKSKRRAHLELMNRVHVTTRTSPHHHYLQSVECTESFSHLKNNLERVFHAQVLLEILMKSSTENTDPALYALLEETLNALDEDSPHALTMEISLLKLAHTLGVLPSFKHCGKCLKVLAEEPASWNAHAGTLHCQRCQESEAECLEYKYLKALEFFKSAPEADYRRVHLAPDEEGALRSFIRRFFENQFPQPMKILEWA